MGNLLPGDVFNNRLPGKLLLQQSPVAPLLWSLSGCYCECFDPGYLHVYDELERFKDPPHGYHEGFCYSRVLVGMPSLASCKICADACTGSVVAGMAAVEACTENASLLRARSDNLTTYSTEFDVPASRVTASSEEMTASEITGRLASPPPVAQLEACLLQKGLSYNLHHDAA